MPLLISFDSGLCIAVGFWVDMHAVSTRKQNETRQRVGRNRDIGSDLGDEKNAAMMGLLSNSSELGATRSDNVARRLHLFNRLLRSQQICKAVFSTRVGHCSHVGSGVSQKMVSFLARKELFSQATVLFCGPLLQ